MGYTTAFSKHASEATSAHHSFMRSVVERMPDGPFIRDGQVIVPGSPEHYNPEAARFWRSVGFRWDGEFYDWVLDPSVACYKGRRFDAKAWLKSARRRFYEFYPSLAS